MRPIADIRADLDDNDPPPIGVEFVEAWEAYCERVTVAEMSDLQAHSWLTLCEECRGFGPLRMPENIAADPRLTSFGRHVLAALLDVSRDDGPAMAPEVERRALARIFGHEPDGYDRGAFVLGLSELMQLGYVRRTTRGGLLRVA